MELVFIILIIFVLLFCFIGIPLLSICIKSKNNPEQENLV